MELVRCDKDKDILDKESFCKSETEIADFMDTKYFMTSAMFNAFDSAHPKDL